MNLLNNCNLCPRKCGVNRYNTLGFCKASNKIKIAHFSVHEWEEPVISGSRGSGTIFFSNCNLKCVYCQNKKISLDGYGKNISNKKLQEIILTLQKRGVHNINLVTPTHYSYQIHKVLKQMKNNNLLKVPIVYNTSSYDSIVSLVLMKNLVNIYLADLKYYDDSLGEKYSSCNNYFENATLAIDEMYRQVGNFKINKQGIMTSGLIVRVLILPGHIDDAKKIINYLYSTYGDDIFISIMNQYTPINICKYENLNRNVSDEEYKSVIDYALALGVTNAFIQEGEAASESFIPNFDKSLF